MGDADGGYQNSEGLTQQPGQPTAAASQVAEEEIDFKYGAKNLLQLMGPVTLCMILVVSNLLLVSSFGANQGVYLPYTPFHEEGEISGGTKFGQALLNTIIVVCVFTVITLLVVVLYKYECYCIMYGYMFLASVMILAFLGIVYVAQVVREANGWVDVITISVLIYNTSFLGLLSIYWKSPLLTQQVALLFSCVMTTSIFLEYLPVWTAWTLLAGMAAYDLVAVLCPYGPLRMLVNISSERDQGIFDSLVYSSTIILSASDEANAARPIARRTESMSTQGTHSTEDSCNNPEQAQEEEEERGAKLGLGDFIFYSILVGRATIDSNGDWNIILGCVLSILIGLALTLLLLSIFKHALPALPISITLGLLFYFSSLHAITPFTSELAASQAFI